MTIITEPEGYSITLCSCTPPHIGTRKANTPDCCQVCGYMTPEQWEALRVAALAPVVAVLEEYSRTVGQRAPFTTERALFERVENAVAAPEQ